jgi:hypothetical protein
MYGQHVCCLKVDQTVSEIHYVSKTILRSDCTVIYPCWGGGVDFYWLNQETKLYEMFFRRK